MTFAEVLPIIFTIVLIVLGIILSIVGVQLFLALSEFRLTMKRVNCYLDTFDEKLEALLKPLRLLGSFFSGFSSGSRALDNFSSWLNRAGRKSACDETDVEEEENSHHRLRR